MALTLVKLRGTRELLHDKRRKIYRRSSLEYTLDLSRMHYSQLYDLLGELRHMGHVQIDESTPDDSTAVSRVIEITTCDGPISPALQTMVEARLEHVFALRD